VDERGLVPEYGDPGLEEMPKIKTDQLVVDLSKNFESFSSGHTDMIPAIPSPNDGFWGYTSASQEGYTWWKELPTR